MSDKLFIGKVIGTHGIKGEIKIKSDFDYPGKVFVKDKVIYFSGNNDSYVIENVRYHKNAYLVLLKGFYNINDVLFLNHTNAYISREDVLTSEEYVLDDLIDFEVYLDDKLLGHIKDYDKNISYATFYVEGDKNFYLPNIDEYIANIDLQNKKVYTKNVEGLLL